jgi:two-component system, OmpR family, response regulator VanR
MTVDNGKGLVLVVEDNDDSRDVLCMIIENLGYTTISFNSGEGVVESIADKPVALAMLDIMMPKVDGYTVLSHLRDSERFANIPIFLVTAKSEDEEVLEGYQRGADYYIMKPYSSRQVEYGLMMFLEKRKLEL